MSTDESVLADINAAFAATARPQRFVFLVADFEDEDHEAMLQSHHRQTLTREDVPPGWDPMHSCTAEGIAYFFPCLASFALQSPSDPLDWYGQQLIFHLGHRAESNRFLNFCNPAQRRAVLNLLEHIATSRQSLIAEHRVGDDLSECIHAWKSVTR